MSVVNVRWFCAGHGNVGIVQVLDEYEGYKYYIGQCSGADEQSDAKYIASWGSKFPQNVGNLLFGVE